MWGRTCEKRIIQNKGNIIRKKSFENKIVDLVENDYRNFPYLLLQILFVVIQ